MPRQSSAPRAAPRREPVHNPSQPAARRAPSPAPAQRGKGGSLLGDIGSTIAEGMAFGTGRAIANRAVEAVLGPHTVQHRTVFTEATAAPIPTIKNVGSSDVCSSHSKAFQECLNNHGSTDISKCQLYLDMLSECRRGTPGL